MLSDYTLLEQQEGGCHLLEEVLGEAKAQGEDGHDLVHDRGQCFHEFNGGFPACITPYCQMPFSFVVTMTLPWLDCGSSADIAGKRKAG